MKNLIQVVLVLVTIASLGYGYYQSTERSRLELLVEQATTRAERAEMEANRQMQLAEENRKQAQVAMAIGKQRQEEAEKALVECQNRRR